MHAFLHNQNLFKQHQFEWMTKNPGKYVRHLTKEFYASYAASLMNFVAHTETTKKGKKTVTTTWTSLAQVIVRDEVVEISETTINMFLHGPEYTTTTTMGLFEGHHHTVTSGAGMKGLVSMESIMQWIIGQIAM